MVEMFDTEVLFTTRFTMESQWSQSDRSNAGSRITQLCNCAIKQNPTHLQVHTPSLLFQSKDEGAAIDAQQQ